jgi:hypothetical protein
MALPVTPPYVFGNVTSSIPLTNLDADFATIYAAVNGIGNGTVSLANVSITGGTISNVSQTATSYVATKVISTSSNIGAYSYGTLSYSDVNIFESFAASANTYVQNILQNTNAGTAASADYVVSNNLGTATTYYGNFGMNGSGWTGTAGTNSFNAPNMVYLTSTTGDVLIGTTTSNAIRFAVNGGADSAFISTAGVFNVVNDASISGLTVGKGGGAIASNTALGNQALFSNTTASNNTAVGYQAGYSNTTGTSNISVGYQAGYSTTTTNDNTALGQSALYSNQGTENTAVGSVSLNANTTGVNNSAFGRLSLWKNTTGSYNTGYGHSSLFSNTTASNNTAVGYQAGYTQTTADRNAILGTQAGYAATTGSANAYVGYQSGYGNTTGYLNVSLGAYALFASSTGVQNTAIGAYALNVATGSNNTSVGKDSGLSLTSGASNTFVGQASGYAITTGSKNTIIGSYSGNQGGLDIRTASNYIVLSDGDGNPLAYVQNGGSWFQKSNSSTWAITSDARIKKNVISLESGLDVISALRPVEFDYIENDKHDIGFIAQEYQTVLPAQIIEKENGMLSLNQNLVPYLVKAIQELNAKVDSLKQQLSGK